MTDRKEPRASKRAARSKHSRNDFLRVFLLLLLFALGAGAGFPLAEVTGGPAVPLGFGLLLLGSGAATLGILLLVDVTGQPLLGAPLAALAGIAFTLLPFGLTAFLAVTAIVLAGVVLVGLAGYLLVEGLATRWSLSARLGLLVVGYFLVGAAAVGVTAWRVADPLPFLTLPLWPFGVPVMLVQFGLVQQRALVLLGGVAAVLATAGWSASLAMAYRQALGSVRMRGNPDRKV